MNYSKRLDDRRRGPGSGGGGGKDDYSTKGDRERVREKPKVDTKRLAALRSKDKKDSSVQFNIPHVWFTI